MKFIKTPVQLIGPSIKDAVGNVILIMSIWRGEGVTWRPDEAMAHLDDIVLAVNSYDDLVASLRHCVELLDKQGGIDRWPVTLTEAYKVLKVAGET